VAAVAVLPVAGLVAVLIHELGHVAAGRLTGMWLVYLMVGPLRVARDGERLRWGWDTRRIVWGGVTGMAGGNGEELRRRMMWFIAGGPLFSAGAAVGFGLLAYALGEAGLVAGVAAAVNLLTGATAAVPSEDGQVASDGRRLQMLWKGGAQAERWMAVMALGTELFGGKRPRELDDSLLAAAVLEGEPNGDCAVGHYLAYLARLDRGDVAGAGAAMERMMEEWDRVAKAMRGGLELEAAFFAGAYQGNAAEARRLYEGAAGDRVTPERAKLQAEAAVLLAEGRRDEARERVERALQLRPEPDGKARWMDTEWLEARRAEL
jgi:hypothetical protein